jgi:hypothetical protein
MNVTLAGEGIGRPPSTRLSMNPLAKLKKSVNSSISIVMPDPVAKNRTDRHAVSPASARKKRMTGELSLVATEHKMTVQT